RYMRRHYRPVLGLHRGVRAIEHVMVIDLENEDFQPTFGPNCSAVYLNTILLPQGELITNCFATSHASFGTAVDSTPSAMAGRLVRKPPCRWSGGAFLLREMLAKDADEIHYLQHRVGGCADQVLKLHHLAFVAIFLGCELINEILCCIGECVGAPSSHA